MRRQVLLFLLAATVTLFVGGAIMPGALRETVRDALNLSGVDGFAHLFFCGLMAMLMVFLRVPTLIVILVLVLLGSTIELLQVWIPGRSPAWSDFIDNGVGAIAGVLFAWWLSLLKLL